MFQRFVDAIDGVVKGYPRIERFTGWHPKRTPYERLVYEIERLTALGKDVMPSDVDDSEKETFLKLAAQTRYFADLLEDMNHPRKPYTVIYPDLRDTFYAVIVEPLLKVLMRGKRQMAQRREGFPHTDDIPGISLEQIENAIDLFGEYAEALNKDIEGNALSIAAEGWDTIFENITDLEELPEVIRGLPKIAELQEGDMAAALRAGIMGVFNDLPRLIRVCYALDGDQMDQKSGQLAVVKNYWRWLAAHAIRNQCLAESREIETTMATVQSKFDSDMADYKTRQSEYERAVTESKGVVSAHADEIERLAESIKTGQESLAAAEQQYATATQKLRALLAQNCSIDSASSASPLIAELDGAQEAHKRITAVIAEDEGKLRTEKAAHKGAEQAASEAQERLDALNEDIAAQPAIHQMQIDELQEKYDRTATQAKALEDEILERHTAITEWQGMQMVYQMQPGTSRPVVVSQMPAIAGSAVSSSAAPANDERAAPPTEMPRRRSSSNSTPV